MLNLSIKEKQKVFYISLGCLFLAMIPIKPTLAQGNEQLVNTLVNASTTILLVIGAGLAAVTSLHAAVVGSREISFGASSFSSLGLAMVISLIGVFINLASVLLMSELWNPALTVFTTVNGGIFIGVLVYALAYAQID